MKITEDLEFKARLIKWIAEREFSERVGIHCSDLIYCVNKQAFRRLNPLPDDEHELLLFSLGWATQRWLTSKLEDATTIEVDGIQVTPDVFTGISLSLKPPRSAVVGITAPWELKCTYQSSQKPIEENMAWMKQLMAQCYVTKSNVAWLSRLEIMGNWKSVFGKAEEKIKAENQKPTLHAYRIEFTEEELKENWVWLRWRRELFLDLLDGKVKVLPKKTALPTEQEWECQYCRKEYKEICFSGQ